MVWTVLNVLSNTRLCQCIRGILNSAIPISKKALQAIALYFELCCEFSDILEITTSFKFHKNKYSEIFHKRIPVGT